MHATANVRRAEKKTRPYRSRIVPVRARHPRVVPRDRRKTISPPRLIRVYRDGVLHETQQMNIMRAHLLPVSFYFVLLVAIYYWFFFSFFSTIEMPAIINN